MKRCLAAIVLFVACSATDSPLSDLKLRRRRRLGRAIHRGALLGGDRVGEGLLAEPRNVPNADGLVEGGGENEVVLRVELRAHDVVVVPREHLRSAAAERGVSAAVAGVSGQKTARRAAWRVA